MPTLTLGQSASLELPAGQRISITAGTSAVAGITRKTGSTVTGSATVMSGETVTLGEYFIAQNLTIECLRGAVTYTITQSAENVRTGPTVALDGGVLLLTSDGAPVDGAQAALVCDPTGNNNSLTFTAVDYGARGNLITIAYVDPGANSQALAVSVTDQAITVSLATNGSGTITSTAALILAAIEAHPVASTMVTVANTGGNDGSGVVTALAAAPMVGGEGTGVGTAGKGSICIDYDGGDIYRNSGTAAAPVWTQLADAA